MADAEGVFLQVLNNRLRAIVEEMAQNILQAAHSAFIKETWDLGAVLTTPEGEVFACPKEVAQKRLGLHLGPALEHARKPTPGDIFLTNDPRVTGGLATHLPDIFMWKPIFAGEEVVAFALAFVHVSDVGGIVPGGISPNNTELFQEGIMLPPVRIFAGGELQEEIRDILLGNSRVPRQLWGDLTAVVGSLNAAERRVHELLEQYPVAEFRAGVERLLSLSEERARAIVRRIPNGRYTFVDYLDGMPDMDPIRLCLALEVEDETITMNFEGSDPEVKAAYNLFSHSRDGHWGLSRVFADYFQTMDPDVPWNSGLVRPIKVRAPKGSVLNPIGQVACGCRVSTYYRVYYMVFGALAQATPGAAPASGPAESGVMLIAVRDPITRERKMSVAEPVRGGCGARPHEDGLDGTELTSSYLRNIPVEILEAEVPVRILEYRFEPGTGGAGRYRGGMGSRVAVQFLAPETTVTIRALQRHQFRAWGVAGGRPGSKGTVTINPGAPGEKLLPVVNVLNFKPGETLRTTSAGGGGFGDPLEREAERVAFDVLEGNLDAELALRDYGVVILDGQLDAAKTEAVRVERRGQQPALGAIDYGPERLAYEGA